MAAKKSGIDTKLIRELADLLNDTEMQEVEIEEGDMRIRLARTGGVAMASTIAVPPAAPVAAPAPVAAAAAPAPAASAEPAAASGTGVTSPMVGTAYHSPAPGADAFVKVGDHVKKGQTIMIVEAMKTMNQIPSSHDGVVASIDVEDGQPVEFGERLITLS